MRTPFQLAIALCAIGLVAGDALAQPGEQEPAEAEQRADQAAKKSGEPKPFGANLFQGNFAKQREDGVNPDYVVMPGDRVQVNTWGTVDINEVFTVDTQGNIFLPTVGPAKVAGVQNKDLTRVVRERIGQVYRRFEVYTNLLTAAPVAVFVTGGVANPGRYAGVPSDSVLFYIDSAGGIDPALGSYRKIKVLRGDAILAEVDLYDFILNGKIPDVQLADGDTILVGKRGPVIELRGDVASSSLIEMTGTPIRGADALAIVPKRARANEVTVRGMRGGKAFLRTYSVDRFRSVRLQDGDAIQFRDDAKPGTILVNLEGEFRGPSVLSVSRGARLLDVLNYVEVDPALSDVGSIHLRRAAVAQAQKKSIEDSLHRLERSALLAPSATEKEAQIRAQEAQLMQSFIKSARLIQPLGRVVTARDGEQLNVLLEDGDTIVIPSISNVVRVSGEVQVAHAIAYGNGTRARHYIHKAGGYTKRSDRDKVIVIHASAAVTVGSPETPVGPGDEILVLPEVSSKLLQNAADVTQVIYQIAVAAAVVLAI